MWIDPYDILTNTNMMDSYRACSIDPYMYTYIMYNPITIPSPAEHSSCAGPFRIVLLSGTCQRCPAHA